MAISKRSLGVFAGAVAVWGAVSLMSPRPLPPSSLAEAAAQEPAPAVKPPPPVPGSPSTSPATTPAPTTTPAPAPAATTEPAATKEPVKPRVETATFGAGCFWSTEAVFERYKGVLNVTSGFSGGNVPNPSYERVCTGTTGHAEVVNVEFDPSVISYESLLKIYFHAHDPTTVNAQGDDFGPQYRSVIFYHNEQQRLAALAMYKDLTARRAFRSPIVTQLVPFAEFYPAEPYHQDYFRNHRGNQYSEFYIVPKLKKMSKVKIDSPPASSERGL